MTPDERSLLSGLFERTRQAGDQPRDREAEALIQQAVSQQPYAPYLLAQTVLVQEQALRAASERLQQLEAENRALQERGSAPPQPESGTSFLGGLGKSLFGGGVASAPPPQQAGAPRGPWGQTTAPPQPQGWAQQPPQQQGWGQQQPMQQAAPGGGSSFLHGALGTAAGVAGGVLLANSIRGLFSGGSNPMGIGSGFGGGMPGAPIGGETVINNYYGSDDRDSGTDSGTQDASWSSDNSSDDSGTDWGGDTGGSDDTYDA